MAIGKLMATWCMWAVAGMAMAVPANNAELKKQVADTERAFAVFSGPVPLHGKQAVADFWKKLYAKPDAPFSWEPTEVAVLDSGLLAFSSGPVYDPAGKLISKLSSILQRDPEGRWKSIFDHGRDVCDCQKPTP